MVQISNILNKSSILFWKVQKPGKRRDADIRVGTEKQKLTDSRWHGFLSIHWNIWKFWVFFKAHPSTNQFCAFGPFSTSSSVKTLKMGSYSSLLLEIQVNVVTRYLLTLRLENFWITRYFWVVTEYLPSNTALRRIFSQHRYFSLF